MDHLDSLAVEVKILFVGERVGGPSAGRIRRLIAILHAHAIEKRLMRDHRRALARVRDVAGDVAAYNGAPQAGDLFVAAGMIGMHVRVDHIADGSVG